MAPKKTTNGGKDKRVTRYTYENVMEPRTPETGHTALLPADEQVVTIPMDSGWSKAMKVGRLPENDERPVVVDMDPAADPTLFWAGKRNRRQVPLLPLQRNEIVSESRLAQIIDRARKAALEKAPQMTFGSIFADLEKTFRESDKSKRIEFYSHEEGWKNKLICGDSLHVMESLAQYEQLRGQVQMIYIDPPYGIRYNSNFQQRVDSTKNEEKDQADDILTIKAFRDTWTLGIHSYLNYLQERLYLCRELLSDSGSVFVQMGEDNLHFVRALMSEVFGSSNYITTIAFRKTGSSPSDLLGGRYDYLLWFAKEKEQVKFRRLYTSKELGDVSSYRYKESPSGELSSVTEDEKTGKQLLKPDWKLVQLSNLATEGAGSPERDAYEVNGKLYRAGTGKHWKTSHEGLNKLVEKKRIVPLGSQLNYKRYFDDFPWLEVDATWDDTGSAGYSSSDPKVYVVQTDTKVIARCIQMTTEPGEIVLDITCGSGTTAYASEQLGRRWIACDISRVALNVARRRLLSSTFDHYKTRNGRLSNGFVCRAVPRITLKSLAYDMEPEQVELVDQPEIDSSATRVTGPFEVMSLGRYSVEDWKGYVATSQEGVELPKLKNYIDVICRLYRQDAALQGANGLIHAVAESEKEKIAISVGPLSGRVTAKQVNDAVQDALASGILEVHVLGWAFEANVGEVKAQLERRGKVKVVLQMIRPDTLAEGLKVTKPETLFSPLALPDIEVAVKKNGKEPKAVVHLKGVAVFDRKNRSTDYMHADSGYVSAWYLDEDYDGDCFVDCQMFFDFKKAPNLKALGVEVEANEFNLQVESQPFAVRGYKRIAVKVVDVFGNESTVVHEL